MQKISTVLRRRQDVSKENLWGKMDKFQRLKCEKINDLAMDFFSMEDYNLFKGRYTFG